MARIVVLPEKLNDMENSKMFKFALSYKPDYIFQICLINGLKTLDNSEYKPSIEKEDISWLIKSLYFLSDKVNFVEDEIVLLSEEIYTCQLKVWFTNYSIPLYRMSKQQINQTLNKIIIFAA